jgi:two-component system chemotaxis sensor kinase CheA
LDLAKYRTIFVEESTEHLSEISTALLRLEKQSDCADAIDSIFRMAHSIKGMAASMGYDSIAEVAHRLEDRMQATREAGRAAGGDELALLFRGLEGLEAMVGAVRATGEEPPPNPELARALADAEPAWGEKKKP